MSRVLGYILIVWKFFVFLVGGSNPLFPPPSPFFLAGFVNAPTRRNG